MAVVDVPPSFPPKWDLADALPEGWTVERLSELLDNALPGILLLLLNLWECG